MSHPSLIRQIRNLVAEALKAEDRATCNTFLRSADVMLEELDERKVTQEEVQPTAKRHRVRG